MKRNAAVLLVVFGLVLPLPAAAAPSDTSPPQAATVGPHPLVDSNSDRISDGLEAALAGAEHPSCLT